jgi:integrase
MLKYNQMTVAEQDPMAVFTYALRAPETRRQYPRRFKVFLDFLKIYGSLQQQAITFLTAAKQNKAWAEDSFMKFIEYQKQRSSTGEIAASTISNYYKATKLFCEMNDLVLNWKKIARGLPRGKKAANDRAPTTDEMKKLLEYPDRRIKPIILVMASSGIRVGAWDELQWKHVTPIKNDKGEIIAAKLTIYPGDQEEYFTFITSEAYFALADWMKFRVENGEEITGNSWVMRDIWQTTNMKYGARFGLATNPKKLESIAITRILERAAWEQGVRNPLPNGFKRHEWKVSHGFRKFYKSCTEFARMKSLNIELLMGHDIGISKPYYKPTEQELLKDYLNAVDQLTIIDDSQKVHKTIAELQKRSSDNEYILKAKLHEKDEQLTKILERQDDLEVRFMEVLRIAKLKDGMIGKDRTILDKDRNITAKYVDDRNQIRTVKFPIDSIDIFDGDAEDNKSN